MDNWSEILKTVEFISKACGIILSVVNVGILLVQRKLNKQSIELNKQSIEQTKVLSNLSHEKTEMLSKKSRFLEYDNLLNSILYEFYESRNEILGLEKNTQEVIIEIGRKENTSLIETQLAILKYKTFLERFKLSTTFVKLQENGYIFFIKENFKDTIWENIWKSNSDSEENENNENQNKKKDLLMLHNALGKLVNTTKFLDSFVGEETKKLYEITKGWNYSELFLKEDPELLEKIKKIINPISTEISNYKNEFVKSVDMLPDECETYKIIKDLNNNNQTGKESSN